MNKPIEAGCRAVIVNSDGGNNGVVVTVLEKAGVYIFIGPDNKTRCCVGWIINKSLTSWGGNVGTLVPEFQLQRIDDYDGNDIVSWDDMKNIWQPERVEELA